MLTVRELGTRCTASLTKATGLHLSPRSSDWMGCIFSAAMASLPTFIEAFVACIGGAHKPPPDHYNPGDRQRCD